MCSANLSPADDAALTAAWEVLQTARDNTAANTSYSILGKASYTQTDWENWFDQYFNTQGHYLTEQLWWNAIWGILTGFDLTTRVKLQTALVGPIWTRFTDVVSAHPSDLGVQMGYSTSLAQTMWYINFTYSKVEESNEVSSATLTTIFNNYAAHIRAYPQYWSASTTLDLRAQPFIGSLREYVWVGYINALTLDASLKNTIKSTIQVPSGPVATLWDNYTALLVENNQFASAQVQFVNAMMAAIPTGLIPTPNFLTCRDLLIGPSGGPILRKGWNGGVNYNFGIWGSSFTISFDNVLGGVILSSGTVPMATWAHVAATFDGTTNPDSLKTYINGVLSTTGKANGVPNSTSTQDLSLGNTIDMSTYLTGKLDETKIYGRCLSGTEISNEYNGIPVSTANLVGWWRMDETGGTLVADSSGLGNNGTNIGGVTIVPGWLNNGLSFDGIDDKVIVPDNASLRLPGAFTVESWVNFIADNSPFPMPGKAGFCNVVGGPPVGTSPGNDFPDDISPEYMDSWATVVVHETNHVVNHYYIGGNPSLSARQTQLIAQAGSTVDLQYLRSQIGAAYFTQYPQEFFASISQEYFNSTQHTLELGLQRFNAGYDEPINQFIFFADVYSYGTNTTKFYDVDSNALIAVSDATLVRDGNGHITDIIIGANHYRFTVDASGNVTSYVINPPPATRGM